MTNSLYRSAASAMLLGVLPATAIFWSVVIWTQEDGVPFIDVLESSAVPVYVLGLAPALMVSAAHTRFALLGTSTTRDHPLLWSIVLGAALGLLLAALVLLVRFGPLTALMWPTAIWGVLTGGIYGAFVHRQNRWRTRRKRSR